MSLTVRERACRALHEQIAAALPDVLVERNRARRVEAAPWVGVVDGRHDVVEQDLMRTEVGLTMQVYGYVRADVEADGNVGTEANALYGRISEAVFADRTLGLIADDVIEVSMQPDFTPDLDLRDGSFVITYRVALRTDPDDVTQPAP